MNLASAPFLPAPRCDSRPIITPVRVAPTMTRAELRALHPRRKKWTQEDREASILQAVREVGKAIAAPEIRIKAHLGNDYLYPTLRAMVKAGTLTATKYGQNFFYSTEQQRTESRGAGRRVRPR